MRLLGRQDQLGFDGEVVGADVGPIVRRTTVAVGGAKMWSIGIRTNRLRAFQLGCTPRPRAVSRRPLPVANARKPADQGVALKSPATMQGSGERAAAAAVACRLRTSIALAVRLYGGYGWMAMQRKRPAGRSMSATMLG